MNTLLDKKIFDRALIAPLLLNQKLNNLNIVSGYASSAMGFHHLDTIGREYDRKLNINLIYGMAKSDGITQSNHIGFQSLCKAEGDCNFSCSYLYRGEPVHAKIYIWCENETPVIAFTGSANYTQTAFLTSNRREVLTECNPNQAYDFYKSLSLDTIDCLDANTSKYLKVGFRFSHKNNDDSSLEKIKGGSPVEIVEEKTSQYYGLQKATLSLVDRKGDLPIRSGLNWGQRPELGRDPNQAYLSVRGNLRKIDYFPPIGVHFTVLTDDGKILQCSRAQAGGKGIHTPHDNSEIGRYIRERLGVPSGKMVRLKDLEKYGRKTIDFYKLDDENFYMDFSKPSK